MPGVSRWSKAASAARVRYEIHPQAKFAAHEFLKCPVAMTLFILLPAAARGTRSSPGGRGGPDENVQEETQA